MKYVGSTVRAISVIHFVNSKVLKVGLTIRVSCHIKGCQVS